MVAIALTDYPHLANLWQIVGCFYILLRIIFG